MRPVPESWTAMPNLTLTPRLRDNLGRVAGPFSHAQKVTTGTLSHTTITPRRGETMVSSVPGMHISGEPRLMVSCRRVYYVPLKCLLGRQAASSCHIYHCHTWRAAQAEGNSVSREFTSAATTASGVSKAVEVGAQGQGTSTCFMIRLK